MNLKDKIEQKTKLLVSIGICRLDIFNSDLCSVGIVYLMRDGSFNFFNHAEDKNFKTEDDLVEYLKGL